MNKELASSWPAPDERTAARLDSGLFAAYLTAPGVCQGTFAEPRLCHRAYPFELRYRPCPSGLAQLSSLRWRSPRARRIAAAARQRAAAVAPLAADLLRLHGRRPATASKWAAGGLASTTPRNPERDSSSSRRVRADT